MQHRVLSPNVRTKKAGILIVSALFALTLAGHLATRDSSAVPAAAPPELIGSDSLVTLAAQLDRTAVLAGGDGEVKMELTLTAADAGGGATRAPVDMIVVLDRSPSMAGEKIEAARAAIHELIRQLRAEDRLALVAFAWNAEVLIPPQRATPEARAVWHRTVDRIGLVSATNVSGGLDLALELAQDVRRSSGAAGRMLLISDGEANQGDVTVEGLTRRAARATRFEFALSSIGVGDHFNEFLMSAIADAGTGNYYYLSETRQLAEVFASELGATRETVARAVAVTVAPAPGVEVLDAAGYPLERSRGAVTFRPGTLFVGQERRVWVTLRVPNAEPGERQLGTFAVAYDHAGERRTVKLAEAAKIACVGDRTAWLGALDRDAWSRSVVEEDYSRLRQRVASFVKAGRRDEALREIETYHGRNETLNRALASAEVAANLEEVKKLAAEVEDAFTGPDQARKQNVLSKSQQAAGWDARRAGSKRKAR